MLLAMIGMLAESCTKPTPSQAPEPRPRVRICLMQDRSGSIHQTRTATITAEDLAALVAIVRERGGELALGIIGERGDLPLLRLPIEPPPPPPSPPPRNPIKRRKWEEERRKYESKRQAWEETIKAREEAFMKEAEERLQAKLSRISDVCGGIRRCDLMLAEPYGAPTVDFMVLVTDGLHNVRGSACPETLNSQARVLLVNGAATTGAVERYKPMRLESVKSAIQFIKNLEEKR